jgi:hypothetical protein
MLKTLRELGIEQRWELGCQKRMAWRQNTGCYLECTANYGKEQCKKKKKAGRQPPEQAEHGCM